MKNNIIFTLIVLSYIIISCVKDRDHDIITIQEKVLDTVNKTKITFADFDSDLYKNDNNIFTEDVYIEGYVISTDINGSYFNEIYIQNTPLTTDISPNNPRMGIKINIQANDIYTKYPLGRKLQINLKGLKGTTSKNIRTLAKQGSFGFTTNIELAEIDDFIFETSETLTVEPKTIAIGDLSANDIGTLIQFENVHFQENEHGKSLANENPTEFDEYRTLEACDLCNSQIELETSNFSDFAQQPVSTKQMDITGIYTFSFDTEPVFVINSSDNITEIGEFETCNITTNPNILITEIADPANASKARYIEIYNADDTAFCLKGWSLLKYVNGGEPKEISLENTIINAKSFLIIADKIDSTTDADSGAITNPNFNDAFKNSGITADLLNTNADGNGDDAYTLINEKGDIVDIYGVTTEDGSGKEWDYEDARVYRNIDITSPNPTFDINEWTIIQAQNAPNDFSPKERKDNEIKIITETAPLFISEIADPKENAKARFVEIYNPTDNEVSLKDWILTRYNKTSKDNVYHMSLTGLNIAAKGTIVITRDLSEFNTYFRKTADKAFSNLDGNGDDPYELTDPFGKKIDLFGELDENGFGKDGTGTNWEYEDGYAQRNKETSLPNDSSFNHNNWTIKKNITSVVEYTPGIR